MLSNEKKVQLATDLDILFELAKESSQKKTGIHKKQNRSDDLDLKNLVLTPTVAKTSAKAMIDINKNSFFQARGEPVPEKYNMQQSASELILAVEIVMARKDIKKNPEALLICHRIIGTLTELMAETLKEAPASAPRKK
jgi:hypothetical protein